MFFIHSLGNHLESLFPAQKRILTLCCYSTYKGSLGLEIRCSVRLSYGRFYLKCLKYNDFLKPTELGGL